MSRVEHHLEADNPASFKKKKSVSVAKGDVTGLHAVHVQVVRTLGSTDLSDLSGLALSSAFRFSV